MRSRSRQTRRRQNQLHNSDDDKDGIIYIKSIDAGKYDVSLNEIDGYISKENSYKVTVKDKIEYTKVDVKDEIKSQQK